MSITFLQRKLLLNFFIFKLAKFISYVSRNRIRQVAELHQRARLTQFICCPLSEATNYGILGHL